MWPAETGFLLRGGSALDVIAFEKQKLGNTAVHAGGAGEKRIE